MKTTLAIICTLLLAFAISHPVLAETVNINKADAATLQANLEGIGPKKAKAIVDYRKKNGPFKSINDLANVKGIGEATVKKNKKSLSLKKGATKLTKKTEATKKKTQDKASKAKQKSKDTKKSSTAKAKDLKKAAKKDAKKTKESQRKSENTEKTYQTR